MLRTRKLIRIQYTKAGYENLKEKYAKILASRPDAVKTLSEARELGDLSENGLYKAARAKLSSIDSNLRRLEMFIKCAEVVDKPDSKIVGIGNRVTVTDGKNTSGYDLVGKYEADPKIGKISDESPIGKALVGKKVGDIIFANTPNGQISYKILRVEISS